MTTLVAAPAVTLDLPVSFHPVPGDVAIEDRAHAVTALLDTLAVSDPRRREALALYLQALSRSLQSGPVFATAFCAVQLDGDPSVAALGVALQYVPQSDPLVAVAGTAQVWRQEPAPRPGRTIAVERAGHRLLAVRTRAAAPDGPLADVSVLVPLEGTSWAVLVTVATPDAAHLANYARVARTVATSARLAAG